jgi:sensor domain CHASE-containing protein
MFRSVRARFANLENYHSLENSSRARNLIAERADHLARHASDWGAWDATYNFVDDLNEKYVSVNLNEDGIARLNINCLLFLDAQGNTKASIGFDLESEKLCELPNSILRNDWSRYSLAKAELKETHSGIVIIDSTPYLMGASQILTSEGTGPIRGTIIELRKIDDRELASLSNSLRFPIKVKSCSKISSDQIRIEFVDDKSMDVSFGINELMGANSVDFFCKLDRRIMAEGKRVLDDTHKYVLLMVGLLSLLMYFAIGKFIIVRVCKMTEEINSLNVDSSVFQVSDRGNDEVGDLAKQFNSLIKSMLASQSELCNSNVELARSMLESSMEIS